MKVINRMKWLKILISFAICGYVLALLDRWQSRTHDPPATGMSLFILGLAESFSMEEVSKNVSNRKRTLPLIRCKYDLEYIRNNSIMPI
jgi:hypothetical protein